MKKTPEEIARSILERDRKNFAKAASLLARDLSGKRAMDLLEGGGEITIATLLASFEATIKGAKPEMAIMEQAAIDYLRSIQQK